MQQPDIDQGRRMMTRQSIVSSVCSLSLRSLSLLLLSLCFPITLLVTDTDLVQIPDDSGHNWNKESCRKNFVYTVEKWHILFIVMCTNPVTLSECVLHFRATVASESSFNAGVPCIHVSALYLNLEGDDNEYD